MIREMKGISPTQFAKVLAFVQKYHSFARWASDKEVAEVQALYPKMGEFGFNIKYVRSCYDSRFKDIWSVTFSGMGGSLNFNTNTKLDLPFETLEEWISAYLKSEWTPTKEELETLKVKE